MKESNSHKAYDYMIKFRIPYKHRIENESFTVAELFENICTQAGVEIGDLNFANAEYEIVGNAYTNNETCEFVLRDIAKLAGGYARIGRDNKCYIHTLSLENAVEIIDGNNYLENFTSKGVYGPVNQIYVGLTDITGEMATREDEESIEENGLTQVKANDVFFLTTPVEREAIIDPIWVKVNGLTYLSAEFEYQGFPYLDAGDKINLLNVADEEYPSYLLSHTFKYNGAYSGKISSPMPDKIKEDYQSSGKNISAKFRRVEYDVNKIDGEIESIIEEVYDEDGIVNTNYTNLLLQIGNIVNNVQTSGGDNLIKNSVMFAYDTQRVPENWELSGEGTLTIESSPDVLNKGVTSGHVFTLKNKIVKQRVNVRLDTDAIPEEDKTYYTFTTKISKAVTGTCYVRLYNSNEDHLIELTEGESSDYGEYKLEKLLPKDTYYDIEFYGSELSNATFTDNMLSLGQYSTQWTQANGEIMNTQVIINENGVITKSSIYQGDYTVMSPLEFSGYSNINGHITKIFTLNKETTEVEKLLSKKGISMAPIKIVPVTEGELQGWAFVKSSGGDE